MSLTTVLRIFLTSESLSKYIYLFDEQLIQRNIKKSDEVETKRLFLNKEIELILITELSSLKFNVFFLSENDFYRFPDAVPKKII